MFYCVTVSLEIVLLCASEMQRVVCFPIDIGVMSGIGKRSGIKGIDVGSHTVVLFLG